MTSLTVSIRTATLVGLLTFGLPLVIVKSLIAQAPPANSQREPVLAKQTVNLPNGPQVFQPTVPLRVVAQVNRDRIRRTELGQACLDRYGLEVLETLMNRMLILQQCKRLNLQVTQEEIDSEIDTVAERFQVSRKQWLKMLQEERNITPEQYAEDIIWPTIALRKLAASNLEVKPEEVRMAYETQFGPAVLCRMILVDDEPAANKLRDELNQHPDRFARLAINHSVDTYSRASGGLIQPVRKHVGYEAIENVAFGLKPGEISGVFPLGGEGGRKWVILKCERHVPPRGVPYQDVEPDLRRAVAEGKLRRAGPELFQKLQDQSTVINLLAAENPEVRKLYPGAAAVVNEEQIPLDELAEQCIIRYGEDVLENIIARKLLEQALAEKGLQVTQQDLDHEISQTAMKYGFEKDGVPLVSEWLKQVQQERDMSFEIYQEEIIWPSVALKKLCWKDVQVTDEDLQKSFEANFGERVECRAIVLDNQRRAREVWEKARQNLSQHHFEDLSAEYSTDPTTQALRGELPPLHKHSGEPLLEREAFRLKAGEISSVLHVNGKYVILYCVGRIPPTQIDFNVVRDELYDDVFDKKLRLRMSEKFMEIQDTAWIDNFLAGSTHRPGRRSQHGPSLPPAMRQAAGVPAMTTPR